MEAADGPRSTRRAGPRKRSYRNRESAPEALSSNAAMHAVARCTSLRLESGLVCTPGPLCSIECLVIGVSRSKILLQDGSLHR
jgi:hypothetical protein